MKSKTIAIVGSIAALSLAAVPVAQAASPHQRAGVESRLDRSHDAKDSRDKSDSRGSRDRRADHSRDRQSRDHSRDKSLR